MARWVYAEKKKDIGINDINSSSADAFLSAVNTILQDGYSRGIEYSVPYAMKRQLQENVYLFSGGKTYAELKELSELLLSADGNVKPFSKYWQDVQAIFPQYNQSYLEAEYLFAVQSAQMASKWTEFEKDGDRYNLQYRTASDDRVRKTHRMLHDITLPMNDKFWIEYYPPNGWRCRCTAVQVRKSKYEQSDSQIAQTLGEDATNGSNKVFRFNPAKQKVIFPPYHPYTHNLTSTARATVESKAKAAFEIKTADDVVKVVSELGKDKAWFARGFSELRITRNPRANGATDMNGTILLAKERIDRTISAVNKLSKNEKITFDEADSISTFWHEITHNRSKPGNTHKTSMQTKHMELANELVSRNTLPEFYEAFGSKVQFPELMISRDSTGYNTMVVNYQRIIEKTGLEKGKVVEKVKTHLFNEAYDNQREGLENALIGAKKVDGKTNLKKSEINQLVKACGEKSNSSFNDFLDSIIH